MEFHRSQEAISATWNGFDIARIVSSIGKRVAKFADRGIQASLEIDESIFGPEMVLQFGSGDDLALSFGEQDEDTQGLFLEADARAVLADFTSCQVHNEGTKLEGWRARNLLH